MSKSKKQSASTVVLVPRSNELKSYIEAYNKVIAQVAHAIDHCALQSANLVLSFTTPGDPQPMDLYVYWGCMDKGGLQDLLKEYAAKLLEKRNAFEFEKNNIDRQLQAMGIPTAGAGDVAV